MPNKKQRNRIITAELSARTLFAQSLVAFDSDQLARFETLSTMDAADMVEEHLEEYSDLEAIRMGWIADNAEQAA